MEAKEQLSNKEMVVEQLLILASNLVLISHALPSSIYIAMDVMRFIRKRLITKDKNLLNIKDYLSEQIGLDKYDFHKKRKVPSMKDSMIENLG